MEKQGHKFLFTSESVTTGHPDKLCDYVSDSVLDACLKEDPDSKVACETATKGNTIMILGEITTKANVVMEKIVRDAIKEVGFDDVKKGMDYKKACVIIHLDQQSQEIANSVHVDKKIEDIGAGDQGMMLGYATNETEECMPLSHSLASQLAMRLRDVREQKILDWVHPDAKTQVTVEYMKNGGHITPVRVHTVLISTSHSEKVNNEQIKKGVMDEVILKVIPKELLDDKTIYHINPSGSFTFAGPGADAGLTGRKIIVDTYGGWGGHGGGAFSGKDPTKVDRSAAYAARWVAKSLVSAGLCDRALVQIAYSIGIARPLSVYVDSYGTVKQFNGQDIDDQFLTAVVDEAFDLRPGCIIRDLDLKKPQFKKLAGYGHFGVNAKDFPWEKPMDLKESCEKVLKNLQK